MSRIEAAMAKAREMRNATVVSPPPPVRSEGACGTRQPIKSVASEINFLSPRLVSINNYNLAIAEEYRKLKSLVIQLTREPGLPVAIMIASSISGEGKSVTALNLAMSLAQEMDHRVLLIDADIRNPSIGRYLGLKKLPGLVECLEDGVSLQDVLLETGLGSLVLLPAGRKVDNPVELMSSAKMKNFFAEIKREFADSFIILDVSPVLPFAEARILSNLVDSVVFVVKEGGCSMRNVHESLEILGNANILGLVYNKATAASLSGGYQYYYYDYDSINRYSQPVPAKSWKDRFSAVFKR